MLRRMQHENQRIESVSRFFCESAKLLGLLVDLIGIEPMTSSMPWKRAPSCATGPLLRETNSHIVSAGLDSSNRPDPPSHPAISQRNSTVTGNTLGGVPVSKRMSARVCAPEWRSSHGLNGLLQFGEDLVVAGRKPSTRGRDYLGSGLRRSRRADGTDFSDARGGSSCVNVGGH